MIKRVVYASGSIFWLGLAFADFHADRDAWPQWVVDFIFAYAWLLF